MSNPQGVDPTLESDVPSYEALMKMSRTNHFDFARASESLRYLAELQRVDEAEFEIIQRRIQTRSKLLQVYRSLLSPIRRLPREILMIVFRSLCCDHYNDIDPLEKRSEDLAALRLGQVCALWREIMLSMQDVWAVLELGSDDGPAPSSFVRQPELLEAYLQRSGDHPLSLCFTLGLYFNNSSNHPFLQRLLSHSARWYRVNAWLDTRYFLLDGGVSPFSCNFPLLEELSLIGQPISSEILSDIPPPAFMHAPRLRYLRILYTPDQAFMVPSTTVRTVDFDNPHDLSNVQSSSLRHIMLNCSIAYIYAPFTGTITNRAIQSLHLYGILQDSDSPAVYIPNPYDPMRPVVEVLTSLRSPSLQALLSGVVQDKVLENHFPLDALVSLFDHHEGEIQLLSFKDLHMTDTQLVEVLTAVPHLTSLTVHSPKPKFPIITDVVLDYLSLPSVLPKLREVDLRVDGPFSEGLLLTMIEMRPWNRVVLHVREDEVSGGCLARLREIRTQGSNVWYFLD